MALAPPALFSAVAAAAAAAEDEEEVLLAMESAEAMVAEAAEVSTKTAT